DEWSRAADRLAGSASVAGEISGLTAAGVARAPSDPPPVSTRVSCTDGTPARRGFQILGPEGWRTFAQDERLLMAQSYPAKPLIGTLQEISRDLTNAQQSPAEALLPLVTERLRINEALRTLSQHEKAGGANVSEMVKEVLKSFEGPKGPGA